MSTWTGKELGEILDDYDKRRCSKDCPKCPMFTKGGKCIPRLLEEDWPKWARKRSLEFQEFMEGK